MGKENNEFILDIHFTTRDNFIKNLINKLNKLKETRSKRDFNFIIESDCIFAIFGVEIGVEERILISFSKERDFTYIADILGLRRKEGKFNYYYTYNNII